jgi:hypothetical protein
VWQQVLEYAKRTPIGEPITFTFYELCQDLGWSINGRYYTKAEECLSRLQATAMGFTSDRVGHLESVSLLHRFRVLDRGKKTSRCQVLIDEEIVVLFAGDHYTKFIWEKYRKLSPTARRMFDYFSSHREPYPAQAGNLPPHVRIGFHPREEVARAGRRSLRRVARQRPGGTRLGQ